MKGDFGRVTFEPRKRYRRVLLQQGRVQVEADWNEQASIQLRRMELEARDVIGASGAPSNDAGFQITLNQGKLTIGKGRFYVDGMLCENDTEVPYLQQPDLPDAVLPALTLQQYGVVYLDVWERHITALDDPRIREVALGGPDTASRGQTVWQVKILPVQAAAGAACGSKFPEWDALLAPSSATLNARTQPAGPEGLCLIPPSAGYQRLENQLYRVEIHKSGGLGVATYKWSRDNGSVLTSIEKVNGPEVTVSDVGPDTVLGFANGQWVELVDERTELLSLPGALIQIDKVDAATRVVTLKSAPVGVDLTRRPKLRRWDSAGELKVETPAADGGWLTLEGGIQVHFAAGLYKAGDYWLIPARTATGEIEWPPYQIPNAAPLAQPPHGVVHHYARLALVQLTANGLQVLEDCRPIFIPLTEIRDEPGIKVTGVNVLKQLQVPPAPPQPLRNDADVSVLDFIEGIDVLFDSAYFKDTLLASNRSGNHPICSLTLDLPFAANTGDRALWGEGLLGFQSIVLSGKVLVVNSTTLRWVPEAACKTWLRDRLFQTTALAMPDRLLVRLTLKGNFIWSATDPNLYLDGEVFGVNAATRVEARLPSGNGMRGGDLEMWFWLMEPPPLVKISQIRVNTTLAAARILSDMTNGTGNKISVFEQDGPNVIEVQFTSAVNASTVVDGVSFVVTRSGTPVSGTITFASATILRWTKTVKTGEPSFLIGGTYQVIIRADGTIPVTGTAGSLMDGELVVAAANNKVILPSGNNTPGGSAIFQIEVIPPPR